MCGLCSRLVVNSKIKTKTRSKLELGEVIGYWNKDLIGRTNERLHTVVIKGALGLTAIQTTNVAK